MSASGAVDEPTVAVRVLSGLVHAAAKLEDIDNPDIPLPVDLETGVRPNAAAEASRLALDCEARGIPGCHMRRRTGGLAGCLQRIHDQLLRGLELDGAGASDRALAVWRFGFVHEWGESSICALRFFHAMIEDAHST